MTYIDGFVIAVPTANKQSFIDFANRGDAYFMEAGARRILECWQADVPHGQHTDFFRAVEAKEDESVVFAFVEWADKTARDKGMAAVTAASETDPRLDPATNPMPFDGARMIYGGFEPIVDEGTASNDAYIQGFIVPVPQGKREAYRKMAAEAWPMFKEFGALRVVEAWGDDVPHGKRTDFFRAGACEEGENAVFSWIEWPSAEVCKAAHEKMMADDRMQPPPEGMPFDGKRMVLGGFEPVVILGE